MRTNIPQIQSIILGSLALIPNDTLRYTALAVAMGLAIIHGIHLKQPSTQLIQLEKTIRATAGIMESAKSRCPRDQLSLAEAWVRLLEAQRSASIIQCRIIETTWLTWKVYRLLSREIAECIKDVRKIRTAVQCTMEAERQRKLTEDISEAQFTLTTFRAPTNPGLMSQLNVQAYSNV
ncbi:hypothetical protein DFH09DRAFT_1359878 [Mycena vulgaris]|nr:hypothetical protein DFH09DRAFT_1359878 [Mycena vulgaris]